MANVLLTTTCNLRCAYCFAQERLHEGGNQVMTVSDAATVIAFLNGSGHPVFRAMGGEPTLHPHFQQIVEMALEAGMRVDVLSNATWSSEHRRFFERVSPEYLSLLLNVDHPTQYAPRVWSRIQENLRAAASGRNVTLSFNIFEMRPRYEYVLELVRQYGIDKIRMSFSLPIAGAHNTFLPLEECIQMGGFVVDFARQAASLGAEVHLDNAVPLCAFTHKQAGELLMNGVLDLRRNARCEPIIDIGPDLRVWCCFCLSKLWNRHLREFENLDQIAAYYREEMGRYRGRRYAMEACGACGYLEKWGCQGGCLSYSVMKPGALAVEDSLRDGWREDAILARAPDAEARTYELPARSVAISRKGSKVGVNLTGPFRTLSGLIDGQHSVGQVLDGLIAANRDPAVGGPVAGFAEREMRAAGRSVIQAIIEAGVVREAS